MNYEQDENTLQTSLTPLAQEQILSISKWVRIISIIGFSLGAFVAFGMMSSGAQVMKMLAEAMPVKVEGLYGALVVVFFIFFFIIAGLLYYLYRSSNLLKQALEQQNTILMAEGFSAIKNFFLIMAVLGGLSLLSNLLILLN